MYDSFGFVHSVIAPFFRKVARDERPGWDHPRKKPDAKSAGPPGGAAKEESAESAREPAGESSTHIDLRV